MSAFTFATAVGCLFIAAPTILLAWFLLRRKARLLFYFAWAMVIVQLGYLISTGAAEDIGKKVLAIPAVKSFVGKAISL